jgi:hypothetical protein
MTQSDYLPKTALCLRANRYRDTGVYLYQPVFAPCRYMSGVLHLRAKIRQGRGRAVHQMKKTLSQCQNLRQRSDGHFDTLSEPPSEV